MGAILGSLQLGAAPLASVPQLTITFNPAWCAFNVLIDANRRIVSTT